MKVYARLLHISSAVTVEQGQLIAQSVMIYFETSVRGDDETQEGLSVLQELGRSPTLIACISEHLLTTLGNTLNSANPVVIVQALRAIRHIVYNGTT